MRPCAKIRAITGDDIPKVVALLKSEGMNYGSVELNREYFHKVLVDGEMVACVAVLPRSGFSEVKSLVVKETHRTFAIFTQISDFVAYKALEQKSPCVVVKVSRHNPATLLYRRRRFVPLTKEAYPDIYKQLRADCVVCHRIVQSVCNPIYMIIDTRITGDTIDQWRQRVEGLI